tara:strand:+ start:1256 stop:1849 length:594 start_codon:yes stop_codon:yes gene_type:complete
MGKPVVKSIGSRSFLDGSAVYENDAKIRGQIEGNIELSDISEPKSIYNITIGPVYYGPDSTVVTAGTDSWNTPSVAICVFRAPRDIRILKLQTHAPDAAADTDSTMTVRVDSISATDAPFGPSGAYRDAAAGWSIGPFHTFGYQDIGGDEIYGNEVTWTNVYSAGTYIRVLLSPTGAVQKPQKEITVTLTIEEDHAE